MRKFLTSTNILNTLGIAIIFVTIVILFALLEKQSKQVSFDIVSNADYSSLYSQSIQNEAIVFKNGQYRKPDDLFSTLKIQLPFARGDINGDFLADYGIIVLHGEKASFSGCDLVLVINKNGHALPIQKIKIPDDSYCDPTNLQIVSRSIILEDDSFEYRKLVYVFKNGRLYSVSDEE